MLLVCGLGVASWLAALVPASPLWFDKLKALVSVYEAWVEKMNL